MKKIMVTGLLTTITFFSFAQDTDGIINAKEVERIEKTLSSNDMQGRNAFTPAIDKAADFIAGEFKTIGLQTWNNSSSYRQEFTMVTPKFISADAVLDGTPADGKSIVVITSQPGLKINEQSGFEKVSIKAGANLFQEAYKYVGTGKNYLVLVDTSFSKNFLRLTGFKRNLFKSATSTIFILTVTDPSKYEIEASHEIAETKLANVVGVLPGKTKAAEFVVFSGHYDHLGIGKPENGDSIYNGANDDAAGTTAVIMLAKYFKAQGNNERTLVFAAFTAEEEGGFGSQYFSKQFDAAKVMAMFNIEMIGTESKWGKNSAYITGYEKTDMGKILEKNLEGTQFKFYPDPYTTEQLFYRSDNATLARLGVPAHTISTSKMDNEPNYHKASDEIQTLDMDNMAMIIKAIAKSSGSIVSGNDTPSRVNTAELR
ncbi:MAG TPA: M20/M25/M40 family metallo-hydrolase [Chitinophagaceae bacterium]|nr:M20/M25/M40 family metallo-hydrolase [Chitinophagaceae bacterium]